MTLSAVSSILCAPPTPTRPVSLSHHPEPLRETPPTPDTPHHLLTGKTGRSEPSNQRVCMHMWLLRGPNGASEGSSEQLLEHLLRRHPTQYLGQNRLVTLARRDGRTCGRHGRSGGGFGRRASSNLGFLGLPMVGPTVLQ